MNNKLHIIPAIIADDFDHLSLQIDRVKGHAPLVQIDVMDGMFAPTVSWPHVGDEGEFEDIIAGDRGMPGWENVQFEVDLMVKHPEAQIEDWIKAGATSVIIHAGSTEKYTGIKEKLTEFDVHMGVAFRPSDEIDPDLFKLASFVQLMGNDKIGYHGVSLDESVYKRAQKIREENPHLDIAVDIGVNADTAHALKEAGVNKLVSGSYIFDSMDMEEAITTLKEA